MKENVFAVRKWTFLPLYSYTVGTIWKGMGKKATTREKNIKLKERIYPLYDKSKSMLFCHYYLYAAQYVYVLSNLLIHVFMVFISFSTQK